MTTIPDVNTAVIARLSAVSGFAAAVPGGVWVDRGPEPAARPFIRVVTRADPADWHDGGYTQRFSVELTPFVQADATGAGSVSSVQRLVMDGLQDAAGGMTLPAASNARVLACVARMPGLSLNSEMLSGTDVAEAAVTAELVVHGDR